MIHAAKSQDAKKNQKFGIELPHSVKRALEIDEEEGNSIWRDAIKKEMATIAPAVSILDVGATAPVGHQWIPCHMIFDIKMDFLQGRLDLLLEGM